MRILLLFTVLAFTLAACSEDGATNSPAPPNNTAQHDTIELRTPPSSYSTLADEWVGKYPNTNLGVRLQADAIIVFQDYRTADVRQSGDRVWFRATDVPFDPFTATFNGTIVGDTLTGWVEAYNRRDSTWMMHELKLNKRI